MSDPLDRVRGLCTVAFWCAAPPGAQAEPAAAPQRYFRPPCVGGRGWVGVWIDGEPGTPAGPDRDEIAEIVTDADRAVAPARLAADVAPPG